MIRYYVKRALFALLISVFHIDIYFPMYKCFERTAEFTWILDLEYAHSSPGRITKSHSVIRNLTGNFLPKTTAHVFENEEDFGFPIHADAVHGDVH